MAALDTNTPSPTEIKLHQKSRMLEISFADGPGQEVLQAGKRDVDISALEPSGSYAVQPAFSDGHSTGIYSWDYLYWLGQNRDTLWRQYLERLAEAGASREPGPAPFEQRPKSK
jgi:DUF971 family protein